MVAAQRNALQRRAVESERAVGTKSLSKMRTISGRKARPLQALVGLPDRGSTAVQSGKYSHGMPTACPADWHPLLGPPARCPNRRGLPAPLCRVSRLQASIVAEPVILS